uniref:Uncharacterized protein n=2 Tax=Davidia involucrata TaxID=16924 RepID=A0A5B6YZS6_DAVIN
MADYLWLVLGAVSLGVAIISSSKTGIVRIFPLMKDLGFRLFMDTFSAVANYATLHYIYVFYRRVPERPIGRFAKAAVKVIVVCAATILRQTFEYNIFVLIILVTVTMYLHSLRRLMHVAADISFLDVVLGALMQVVAYKTGNVIVSGVLIILYGAVIFYSYKYQSTDLTKKQQGDDPCPLEKC